MSGHRAEEKSLRPRAQRASSGNDRKRRRRVSSKEERSPDLAGLAGQKQPGIMPWDLEQFSPSREALDALFHDDFFSASPKVSSSLLPPPAPALGTPLDGAASSFPLAKDMPSPDIEGGGAASSHFGGHNTRSSQRFPADVRAVSATTSAAVSLPGPSFPPQLPSVGGAEKMIRLEVETKEMSKERKREAVRKSRSKKSLYLQNLTERVRRLEQETQELEQMQEDSMQKQSDSPVEDYDGSTNLPKESKSLKDRRLEKMNLFFDALSPSGTPIDEVKHQIWDPRIQLICPLFSESVKGIDDRVESWKEVLRAIPNGRFEVFELSPVGEEAKEIRTKFTFKGTQVNPHIQKEFKEKQFKMDQIFRKQVKKEITFQGKSYLSFGSGDLIVQEICMWNHSELVVDLMGGCESAAGGQTSESGTSASEPDDEMLESDNKTLVNTVASNTAAVASNPTVKFSTIKTESPAIETGKNAAPFPLGN
jgi:hypothetical protein